MAERRPGQGREKGQGARGGRTHRLHFTVHPHEEAEIRQAAKKAGLSVAAFLRNRALGRTVEVHRGPPPGSGSAPSREAPRPEALPPGFSESPPEPLLHEHEGAGLSERESFVQRRSNQLIDAGELPAVARSLAEAEWRKRPHDTAATPSDRT